MAHHPGSQGRTLRIGSILVFVMMFPPSIADPFVSALPTAKEAPEPTEEETRLGIFFSIMKCTEWPGQKIDIDRGRGLAPFTIGVVGRDPFGHNWRRLEGRELRGRTVAIARFGTFRSLEAGRPAEGSKRGPPPITREGLKACDALFLSESEEKNLPAILRLLDGRGVLTMSDGKGFADRGVILTVFRQEGSVTFEVNLDAARKSGLRIRSAALKRAGRVIRNGKGTRN